MTSWETVSFSRRTLLQAVRDLFIQSQEGIATRLRAVQAEVRILVAARLLFPPKRPKRVWGQPTLLFNAHRGSFPEIKRPGSKADHSSPSSVEFKIEWSYTSAPSTCLHAVDRDNFKCTPTYTYSPFQCLISVVKTVQILIQITARGRLPWI